MRKLEADGTQRSAKKADNPRELCQGGERKELHLVNTYYVPDSDARRDSTWVVRKDTGSGI